MAEEPNWSSREHAVVDRYARALGRGRYHDASDAAAACRQALERVWQSHASLMPRTLAQAQSRLRLRGYTLGVHRANQKWSRDETRLLEPFVQAYLHGEFPSVGPLPRPAIAHCLSGDTGDATYISRGVSRTGGRAVWGGRTTRGGTDRTRLTGGQSGSHAAAVQSPPALALTGGKRGLH
jgi:hypothetical protein